MTSVEDLVPTNTNEFIERELDSQLSGIEAAFVADALCLVGDLTSGVDDLVREAVEMLRQPGSDRTRLVVLLTTNGGYIEIVHRIVDTLRHHYQLVAFVIPNRAFSAGTVLAMSGDEIHMDYYSRLGPIDPQVRNHRGRSVPALGYLEKWNELLKKAQQGTLTMPEMAIMLEGFDQAELYAYEHARELSIVLLKDWLVRYKFKNWTKTRTRGRPVTARMRQSRAASIAKQLNNTERWHTHGHGISMEVLRRDLKLEIDDLESKPKEHNLVKLYDALLSDYMEKSGYRGMIHVRGKFVPYQVA